MRLSPEQRKPENPSERQIRLGQLTQEYRASIVPQIQRIETAWESIARIAQNKGFNLQKKFGEASSDEKIQMISHALVVQETQVPELVQARHATFQAIIDSPDLFELVGDAFQKGAISPQRSLSLLDTVDVLRSEEQEMITDLILLARMDFFPQWAVTGLPQLKTVLSTQIQGLRVRDFIRQEQFQVFAGLFNDMIQGNSSAEQLVRFSEGSETGLLATFLQGEETQANLIYLASLMFDTEQPVTGSPVQRMAESAYRLEQVMEVASRTEDQTRVYLSEEFRTYILQKSEAGNRIDTQAGEFVHIDAMLLGFNRWRELSFIDSHKEAVHYWSRILAIQPTEIAAYIPFIENDSPERRMMADFLYESGIRFWKEASTIDLERVFELQKADVLPVDGMRVIFQTLKKKFPKLQFANQLTEQTMGDLHLLATLSKEEIETHFVAKITSGLQSRFVAELFGESPLIALNDLSVVGNIAPDIELARILRSQRGEYYFVMEELLEVEHLFAHAEKVKPVLKILIERFQYQFPGISDAKELVEISEKYTREQLRTMANFYDTFIPETHLQLSSLDYLSRWIENSGTGFLSMVVCLRLPSGYAYSPEEFALLDRLYTHPLRNKIADLALHLSSKNTFDFRFILSEEGIANLETAIQTGIDFTPERIKLLAEVFQNEYSEELFNPRQLETLNFIYENKEAIANLKKIGYPILLSDGPLLRKVCNNPNTELIFVTANSLKRGVQEGRIVFTKDLLEHFAVMSAKQLEAIISLAQSGFLAEVVKEEGKFRRERRIPLASPADIINPSRAIREILLSPNPQETAILTAQKLRMAEHTLEPDKISYEEVYLFSSHPVSQVTGKLLADLSQEELNSLIREPRLIRQIQSGEISTVMFRDLTSYGAEKVFTEIYKQIQDISRNPEQRKRASERNMAYAQEHPILTGKDIEGAYPHLSHIGSLQFVLISGLIPGEVIRPELRGGHNQYELHVSLGLMKPSEKQLSLIQQLANSLPHGFEGMVKRENRIYFLFDRKLSNWLKGSEFVTDHVLLLGGIPSTELGPAVIQDTSQFASIRETMLAENLFYAVYGPDGTLLMTAEEFKNSRKEYDLQAALFETDIASIDPNTLMRTISNLLHTLDVESVFAFKFSNEVVGVEDETVAGHSITVTANLLQEFASDWKNSLLTMQQMVLLTIFHDIGKRDGMIYGGQHAANKNLSESYLTALQENYGLTISKRDITLISEIVGQDIIGNLLKGITPEREVYTIQKAAEDIQSLVYTMETLTGEQMNRHEVIEILLAYYTADASAYPYLRSRVFSGADGDTRFAESAWEIISNLLKELDIPVSEFERFSTRENESI